MMVFVGNPSLVPPRLPWQNWQTVPMSFGVWIPTVEPMRFPSESLLLLSTFGSSLSLLLYFQEEKGLSFGGNLLGLDVCQASCSVVVAAVVVVVVAFVLLETM